MSNELEAELQRRERVSDMMLTAHSILRDRFARLASAFDIVLFALSAILCGTTFLDPALVGYFHLAPEAIRFVLGGCAILVFILSIVGLRVDWKQRSARHQRACSTLADIKAKSRELIRAQGDHQARGSSEFLRASGFAMSELPSIPEMEFVKLKAKHKQKVEISRLLDEYPSAPIWLLRWKLRFRDAFATIHKGQRGTGDDRSSE
jgi:hypothetical protein